MTFLKLGVVSKSGTIYKYTDNFIKYLILQKIMI